MRNKFILIALFVPMTTFALSCPNNGSMLKASDSILEVTARCGQATSTQNYTNTTIISAEWTYYITNLSNNTNTKLTILFDHDQISNINILVSGGNEQNVKSSALCKMPIQVGNNTNYVESACGAPIAKTTLQTESTQMTELQYDGMSPNILVFENDHLIDWK